MKDPQESWQMGQPLKLIQGAHECFEREARFQHGDVHPTKKQVAKLLAKDQLWYRQNLDGEVIAAAEFIELANGSKHKLFADRELLIAPGSIVIKRFGARKFDDMREFFAMAKGFVEWLCSEGEPAELWFEIYEEDVAMKAVAQRMGLRYFGTKVVGQGQIRGLYAVADLEPESLPVHERVGVKLLLDDFLDPAETTRILTAVVPPGANGESDVDSKTVMAEMLKRIGVKLSIDNLTPDIAEPWINLIPPSFSGPRAVLPPPHEGLMQFRIPLKADPDMAQVVCWSLRGSVWRLPLRERMLYFLDTRKPHAYFNKAKDERAAAELVFNAPVTDESRVGMLANEEKKGG